MFSTSVFPPLTLLLFFPATYNFSPLSKNERVTTSFLCPAPRRRQNYLNKYGSISNGQRSHSLFPSASQKTFRVTETKTIQLHFSGHFEKTGRYARVLRPFVTLERKKDAVFLMSGYPTIIHKSQARKFSLKTLLRNNKHNRDLISTTLYRENTPWCNFAFLILRRCRNLPFCFLINNPFFKFCFKISVKENHLTLSFNKMNAIVQN